MYLNIATDNPYQKDSLKVVLTLGTCTCAVGLQQSFCLCACVCLSVFYHEIYIYLIYNVENEVS